MARIKMRINVFSIIVLVWMLILFLISIVTHLTFLYISFGFCLLLAIRLSFQKPDYKTAFTLGLQAAFFASLIYMAIGIIVFRQISVCPFVIIFNLLIIPIISGTSAAILNVIPEIPANSNKPRLF